MFKKLISTLCAITMLATTFATSVSATDTSKTIVVNKPQTTTSKTYTPSVKLASRINLYSVTTAKNGLRIKWSGVKGANGYILYLSTNSKFSSCRKVYVSAKARTFYFGSLADKKLISGKKYYVKVKAYKKVGNGRKVIKTSATKTATTIPTVATTKIKSLTPNSKTNRILVKFNKAKGATGYKIQYSVTLGGKTTTKIAYTANLTKTLTNLKNPARYYVKVIPYAKYYVNGKAKFSYGKQSNIKYASLKKTTAPTTTTPNTSSITTASQQASSSSTSVSSVSGSTTTTTKTTTTTTVTTASKDKNGIWEADVVSVTPYIDDFEIKLRDNHDSYAYIAYISKDKTFDSKIYAVWDITKDKYTATDSKLSTKLLAFSDATSKSNVDNLEQGKTYYIKLKAKDKTNNSWSVGKVYEFTTGTINLATPIIESIDNSKTRSLEITLENFNKDLLYSAYATSLTDKEIPLPTTIENGKLIVDTTYTQKIKDLGKMFDDEGKIKLYIKAEEIVNQGTKTKTFYSDKSDTTEAQPDTGKQEYIDFLQNTIDKFPTQNELFIVEHDIEIDKYPNLEWTKTHRLISQLRVDEHKNTPDYNQSFDFTYWLDTFNPDGTLKTVEQLYSEPYLNTNGEAWGDYSRNYASTGNVGPDGMKWIEDNLTGLSTQEKVAKINEYVVNQIINYYTYDRQTDYINNFERMFQINSLSKGDLSTEVSTASSECVHFLFDDLDYYYNIYNPNSYNGVAKISVAFYNYGVAFNSVCRAAGIQMYSADYYGQLFFYVDNGIRYYVCPLLNSRYGLTNNYGAKNVNTYTNIEDPYDMSLKLRELYADAYVSNSIGYQPNKCPLSQLSDYTNINSSASQSLIQTKYSKTSFVLGDYIEKMRYEVASYAK